LAKGQQKSNREKKKPKKDAKVKAPASGSVFAAPAPDRSKGGKKK